MTLTRFAHRFSKKTGILGLMDNLGKAMNSDMLMLDGGNPAHIPEVNKIWRRRTEETLASYDSPQGKQSFLESLAGLLNMFGGTGSDGIKRKVLFPLCPEYLGYADQSIEEGSLTTRPVFFKYHVDFDKLDIGPDISASNAGISLANGSVGPVLVHPLIESRDILPFSRNIIRLFYQARSDSAVAGIQEAFSADSQGADISCRTHESEGSIFLWLWMPKLPVSSAVLYEHLKAREGLVIIGHYFFYGLDNPWAHSEQCLRLSYALAPERFREAAFIIADEIRRVMDEAA